MEAHTQDLGPVLFYLFRKLWCWYSIYIWGYLGFSFGWVAVLLLFSGVRERARKNNEAIKATAKQISENGEKQTIMTRLNELPAWVYFPDYERSEWLNRVICQLWTSASYYCCRILQTVGEPLIRNSLNAYSLSDFKFTRVSLGSQPPKIGGIKCYDRNTARDEIIIDMDITWAGDSEIEVCLRGMKASILDIYLHGVLRVVLKPLIHSLPLVGGVQVYFLNCPSLDFELGGLANFIDVPIVSTIIRKVVLEQISNFIVLPNKVSFPFVREVPAKILKCPEPEGVLEVSLVEARDLMRMDLTLFGREGKSDPYAVVSVGAQEFRSKTIKNTVDPVWGEEERWEVVVEVVMGQMLNIEMYDWDQGMADEFMGKISIPVSSLVTRGETDIWLKLEEATSGRIRIKTQWLTTTQLPPTLAPGNQQLATALLLLFVDSCKQLPLTRAGLSKPDPVVQVCVTGGSTQETLPAKYTRNPVYEQGFVFLLHDPEFEEVQVKVYDNKSKCELGNVNQSLGSLMKRNGMEYFNQPFKLHKSGVDSCITLHMQILFLRNVNSFDLKNNEHCEEIPNIVEADISNKNEEKNIENSQERKFEKSFEEKGVEEEGKDTAIKNLIQWTTDTTMSPAQSTSITPLQDISTPVALIPSSVLTPEIGTSEKPSLHILYSCSTAMFQLTVKKATNLPTGSFGNCPDSYIEIIFPPDIKIKSQWIREKVHPVFNKTVNIPINFLHKYRSESVELRLVRRKGIFTRQNHVSRCFLAVKSLDLSGVSQQLNLTLTKVE